MADMVPIPKCPKCESRMRERDGPHGKFWGCTRYPKCKGFRDSARWRRGISLGYVSPSEIFRRTGTDPGSDSGSWTTVALTDTQTGDLVGVAVDVPDQNLLEQLARKGKLELVKELEKALCKIDKLNQKIKLREKELDEANREILELRRDGVGDGDIKKLGKKVLKKARKRKKS